MAVKLTKGQKTVIAAGGVAAVVGGILLLVRRAAAVGVANVLGTVTDTQGLPLAEVVVSVPQKTTETKSDGSYILSGLKPQSYTVSFSKSGYETKDVALTLVEGDNILDVELTPEVAPPEKGVLDITTTPIAGPIYVDGVYKGTGAVPRLEVDPGTYTVSFGAVSGYITPSPVTVTVAAGQTRSITGVYELAPPTLGTLIVQTRIALTDQILPGEIYVDGILKGTGSIQIDLPPGTYVVSFGSLSGWETPKARSVIVAAGKTTVVTGYYRPVALEATLEVWVYDLSTQLPIEVAEIKLGYYGNIIGYTDKNGYCGEFYDAQTGKLIPSLDPEVLWEMRINKAGYQEFLDYLTLQPGANTYTAYLVLRPTGLATLHGWVTDAVTGQPIKNVQVYLRPTRWSRFSTATSSAGHYEFKNIESGVYYSLEFFERYPQEHQSVYLYNFEVVPGENLFNVQLWPLP